MLYFKYCTGDSAYPLKKWLLTPFKDNGRLSAQQRRYNRALSSSRQIVERTIAQLKGRFRRLRDIYCLDMQVICDIITAACVLHNMCILHDDTVEVVLNSPQDDNPNRYPQIYANAVAGVQRRNAIVATF